MQKLRKLKLKIKNIINLKFLKLCLEKLPLSAPLEMLGAKF